MNKFNGKHRHNIKRLWNRLKQQYGVEFSMYSNEGENQFGLHWYLNQLFRLHELRKESTNTKSTFKGERVKNFHYDIARTFADKGWLRLGALSCKGEAIAVGYGFNFDKQFNYYQSGLDPVWEKHSVGSTLLLELIKKACEDGCIEFDFLRGDESYKSSWTSETRDLINVYVFNATKRGSLLRYLFHMRRKMKKVLTRKEK
jgi:CelD/BcsL family acetyltransferase involved in cellulose biosynthesis